MSLDPTSPVVTGQKVLILYPDYAANFVGFVIGPEEVRQNVKTGYWLIQMEATNIILALTPDEFVPMPD